MKRRVFLIVLFSVFLFGCPPLPHHYYEEVRYDATTKGKSENIIIKRDNDGKFKPRVIYLQNQKEVSRKKYRKSDFFDLQSIVVKMNLDSINKLEVPSKKYEYDGAMAAQIRINLNSKIYTSILFDDDNPPQELLEIVEYLKAIK